MTRLVVGLSLIASTCLGCAPRKPEPLVPYRIPGFSFIPSSVYIQWFSQAHNCAFRLRQITGDSAHYTVSETAVDLSKITFIAVPTERSDGRFAGARTARDTLFVSGMTAIGGDTIWLPAPQLEVEWLVKHEAMHVFVQSPSEMNYGPHGLPWGFCEFL